MRLNDIKPGPGSKQRAVRLGRGRGSGLGKTAGRGHKGQHARKGGYHKVGFEGGQMPLQRRSPKFGFTSRTAQYVGQVTLGELHKVEGTEITLDALKSAGVLRHDIERAKIIASGTVARSVTVRGLGVTRGARAAILAAGGTIEE